MDLDDSFTERLVQRNKARKDYLSQKRTEAFSVGKKRSALVDEQQVNSDNPPEESPKRQCTEVSQAHDAVYNKENVNTHDDDRGANVEFVPYHSASKTRGLAALKKNFLNDEDDNSKPSSEHQETPTASVKSPVKTISQTFVERQQKKLNGREELEECSDDESIDENDFAENYSDIKSDDGTSKMELDSSPVKKWCEKSNKPVTSGIFKPEVSVSQKSINADVDPAELPLSARKALFEKALLSGSPKINDNVVDHKLSVAQRAAMFEKASRGKSETKSTHFKEPKRIALSNFSKFEKVNNECSESIVKAVQPAVTAVPQEIKASPVKSMVSESVTSTLSPTKNVGNHTRFIHQKLIESSGSNWQQKQTDKAVEERKQEISSLVNRWEKLSSSSSVENSSEMERIHLASDEKASPDSDADQASESEESEHNEDDLNDADTKNDSVDDDENDYDEQDEQQIDNDDCDETSEAHENVFYAQQDKLGSLKSLEENFNEQDCYAASSHNTGSIMSSLSYSGMSSSTDDSSYQASNSHSCNSGSSVGSFDYGNSKGIEDTHEETFPKKENKNPEINLLRTVSAYRREKQETKLTPVRTVVRREKVSSPESPPDTDYAEVIQQQLKNFKEEVDRQQIVISQTSQALNLCRATAEFSGSTEQVEGERLLLIATQKRQACLNEMTRLKTCGAQGENIEDGTGTLTITDLQLPLKREFIASQLEGKGDDTVHYFLCLIRHGPQVIVTQMMSTDDKSKDGTLYFTNHIQLRKLSPDFSVVFEIYALQTKKDVLPHEKKYHIKRENSKKRLTPKGKKFDNKILLPAISSPGGPDAVRSPSFGVVGFTRFTIQNCKKKAFTLDKVPFSSPLDGVLRVKLHLHTEHKVMLKGFLTFYEDVGDRGALYRRWCVLDGNRIAYWMYPDDEHKKEPMGMIDLKKCVTGVVKLVPSLECARPHTFKLVTIRPQKKGDKDTLISRTVNTLTTTKHLLTADIKDERILWCNKINEALTNVRKWDPEAMRPIETMQI